MAIEWTEDLIDEVTTLFQEGKTYKEISDKLGIKYNSVRDKLLTLGIATTIKKYKKCKKRNAYSRTRSDFDTDERLCSRCRNKFKPLSPYLFTCDACKNSRSYAQECTTLW